MLSHPTNLVSIINTALLVLAIFVMGVVRVLDVAERQQRWAKVEEFISAHNEYHQKCQHP